MAEYFGTRCNSEGAEPMQTIVPVIVAVVGLVAYALATNPKAAEVGRILFFVGSLVALFVWQHAVVRLP
jgi:hypothetical protein